MNQPPYITLSELPFTNDILDLGGMVYMVGGSLRDYLMNKINHTNFQSKDVDIMVTKVPKDALLQILKKYGTCDLVGESFGIIKWKDFNSNEEVDISLPRRESATGDRGHKSFDVITDPNIPIEDELSRRDVKINSMAMDVYGKLVDPYGGLNNIKSKIINVTNAATFFDDSLRLLRIIQFSARFDFTIDPTTLKLIQDNASKITQITAERILIELQKILKGNVELGAHLLIETGLYPYIFNQPTIHDFSEFKNVKTLGEFIFLCLNKDKNAADFYKNKLKGDINTTKEIQALSILNLTESLSNPPEIKECIFRAINTSNTVLNTKIFPYLDRYLNEFINKKYPRNYRDLSIDGDDLLAIGYKGPEIGEMLKFILNAILSDSVKNDKKSIMDYIVKSRMQKLGNGK